MPESAQQQHHASRAVDDAARRVAALAAENQRAPPGVVVAERETGHHEHGEGERQHGVLHHLVRVHAPDLLLLHDGADREFVHGQTVGGTHQLLNELGRRIRLKFEFLGFAQARIDHQRQVEGLLRFRLENFDLLLYAFFIHLELVRGEAERGTSVLVQHARQHADEVDLEAKAPVLILVVSVARRNRFRRRARERKHPGATESERGRSTDPARATIGLSGRRFPWNDSEKRGYGHRTKIRAGAKRIARAVHRELSPRADGVSPSAQTAPSRKNSFFQMGTLRLRVSIP